MRRHPVLSTRSSAEPVGYSEPLTVAFHDDEDLLDGTERDDLRQLIAIGLVGVQRGRATADATYTRARNILGFTATLFAAAQAAVITNVAKLDPITKLDVLSRDELNRLLVPGAFGAALLLAAVTWLVLKVDKPRPVDVVSGEKLETIWRGQYGTNAGVPRLLVMLKALAEEEKQWAATNGDRRRAALQLSIMCAVAAAAGLVEFVLLLFAIR